MELTLEQAEKMIQGARQKAQELGCRMSFAVLDSAGVMVASVRMDGAGKMTPRIAQAKGFTAVVFRRPSGEVGSLAKERPQVFEAFPAIVGGTLLPADGGLPFLVNGEVVGALGSSGATPDVDLLCAQAGIAAATGS